MSKAAKLLLIPLVAVLFWALPRDEPRTDVAAAAGSLPVLDDSVSDDFGIDESVSPPTTVALSDGSGPSSSSVIAADAAQVDDSSEDAALAEDALAEPPLGDRSPDETSPDQTVAVEPATVEVAPTTTEPPLPAAVEQPTPTTPIAPPQPEAVNGLPAVAAEGLSRLSFDYRSAFPTWQIEFLGPRSGLRALTYPADRLIEVFVREDDTAASIHRVLAHEIGHVIDVEWNSDSDRQRWRAQRGLAESTPWWPSAEAPDFATGAGDFAEAFAVLETGITTRSQVAGQPDETDLALLRELAQP